MKKKEKKKGCSCFDWTRLSRSPLTLLRQFIWNIQFAYQRIRYGFCERDVWDINQWFLYVIPAMLEDLREGHLDFPERLLSQENGTDAQIFFPEEKELESASEKWEEILGQMAFLFREANEYTCSRKNPYENYFYLPSESPEHQQYRNEREKIWIYRNECLNKGLQMFQEWFWDLWG